jgi:hypothetical protein
MKYRFLYFILFALLTIQGSAQICYQTASATDGLTTLRIAGDTTHMEWLIATDGSQYTWVDDRYRWGHGFFTVDGRTYSGSAGGGVAFHVERHNASNGDLVETYTWTNTGRRTVRLTDAGIYLPLNDNYPDAETCMESRCNVHVWAGGAAAYINALRMSGTGPHLGLVVTAGEVTDYEIFERGSQKGSSNFRGVFALNVPDSQLKPGQSYRLAWRVFAHEGHDFESQLLLRGGVVVSSDKYVYAVGETAEVNFRLPDGSTRTVRQTIRVPGEVRVTCRYGRGKTAEARLLDISGEQTLIGRRAAFILDHQQMNNAADPRYGAYMVYDNEGDSIETNDHGRSDVDEGRERVGMGIFLAAYYERHPSDRLLSSLERYASFVRNRLQTADYKTLSSVSRNSKNRGYNYAWVADFYFRMYRITGERKYAVYGYGTLKSLYRQFGYGFYCIDYPVTIGLQALADAGMAAERDSLLADFKRTADVFVGNGRHFPRFEVNYEQSIVAPAVQFLSELYIVTADRRYLDCARHLLPPLEALGGQQPHYRLNEVAIRHWDGYWFGKRRTFGDVFPHYWSTITATAYYYYAKATGDDSYLRRAENIVRNNLCLFFENGRATCAFVFPRRINGEAAHYADAYANDQDWALAFYLLINSPAAPAQQVLSPSGGFAQ